MQVEKATAVTMGCGEQRKYCVYNSVSWAVQGSKGQRIFSTGTRHQETQFLIRAHDEEIMASLEIFLKLSAKENGRAQAIKLQ